MSLQERVGVALIIAGGVALLAQRALTALRQQQQRARRTTPHGTPLPKTVHAVLPSSATAYKRIIIVGDIHGCPGELRALLDRLQYRRGTDLLLSVGDLVNKGPDSEKVLRMAVEEGMRPVRGNHDDSAYEAFRAWLAGNNVPKPHKQGWVAGLPEDLAAYLAELPFTMQLTSYGVTLVHGGMVPGVTVEQQSLADLATMRDVVPAAEQQQAGDTIAAAALAASGDAGSLPNGSFDWGAAASCLKAQLAAAGGEGDSSGSSSGGGGGAQTAAADGKPSSSGGGDGSTAPASAAAGAATALPAGPRVPAALRLVGRERSDPLIGRAWASLWVGSHHIVFGHDAKRRLQLRPNATGIDTGCVYGGQLTAMVLPPLDDSGRPLLQRCNLPPGAQEFRLSSGLPAFLVQVPAIEEHLHKLQQPSVAEQAQRRALEVEAAHDGAGQSAGAGKKQV